MTNVITFLTKKQIIPMPKMNEKRTLTFVHKPILTSYRVSNQKTNLAVKLEFIVSRAVLSQERKTLFIGNPTAKNKTISVYTAIKRPFIVPHPHYSPSFYKEYLSSDAKLKEANVAHFLHRVIPVLTCPTVALRSIRIVFYPLYNLNLRS